MKYKLGIPYKKKDLPPLNKEAGFSDDVLIDIDGWRKDFYIGWYDFDDKVWRIRESGEIKMTVHSRWFLLALAKYDK